MYKIVVSTTVATQQHQRLMIHRNNFLALDPLLKLEYDTWCRNMIVKLFPTLNLDSELH